MGYLDELAPFGDAEFDRVLKMKDHIQRVQHSSAKSDWRTPPELFQTLDKEFHFDADVAADATNHLCSCWYGPGEHDHLDGLTGDWHDLVCFMNPPYAKAEGLPLEPWLKKAWDESQAGATVVGVLPFNPQTQWFRSWVYGQFIEAKAGWMGHAAMEVRMLPHRVTFNRPDGTPADNAPGNTCIVVWRPNPGYVGPWQPAMRYWSYR